MRVRQQPHPSLVVGRAADELSQFEIVNDETVI
jgi:hypothetical protein